MSDRHPSVTRRHFLRSTVVSSVIGMGYLQFDLEEAFARPPVEVPAGQWPAIFYSPHQDDEAIGMAGAIREHKEAGRPVYLVLLTNGINSGLLDLMNGATYCTWHQTTHDFQLTMDQLCWARKVEFVASARRLGVDRIYILRDGQGFNDVLAYSNYRGFVKHITQTIRFFEGKFPGASHKLVSGAYDVLPDGSANPTHTACWRAAMSLRREITDFRFYRIYVYFKSKGERQSQFQLNLTPEWQACKQASLNEYKLYYPDASRFAIGYHSVGTLIDAAYDDNVEYFDTLP